MSTFLRHDQAQETANRKPLLTLMDAIAKYRDEVRRYAEQVLAPIRKRYGKSVDGSMLEDPYHTQIRLWTARLRGMADLLGLTDEQVDAIDREFGIIA